MAAKEGALFGLGDVSMRYLTGCRYSRNLRCDARAMRSTERGARLSIFQTTEPCAELDKMRAEERERERDTKVRIERR